MALPAVSRLRRQPRQDGGAESEEAAQGARGAQAPVRHLVRLCGLPRRDADPVPVAALHPGRDHSVQSVRAAARGEQDLRSPGRRRDHPGHAEGAASRRAEAVLHGPRRSRARRQAEGTRRHHHGRAVEQFSLDDLVLGAADLHLLPDLDLWHPPHGRAPGVRRPDGDRKIARQGLCRDRHQGDVPGRRRRRRGEIRAAGGRRLPARSEIVRPAGRPHPQGRAADRAAGHRKDAAGARGRRRGGRAVLLDLGLRVRRDVRRRRRRARPRPVRAGAQGGTLHHLHRRTRRAGAKPHARRCTAATTRRSRRSTSCSPSSTASIRAPA